VYGLTELNREAIKGARLVANPGCYPTSVQLPLVPLLAAGLIQQVGSFGSPDCTWRPPSSGLLPHQRAAAAGAAAVGRPRPAGANMWFLWRCLRCHRYFEMAFWPARQNRAHLGGEPVATHEDVCAGRLHLKLTTEHATKAGTETLVAGSAGHCDMVHHACRDDAV